MQLSQAQKSGINNAMRPYTVAVPGQQFADLLQKNVLDILDYFDPASAAFAIDRDTTTGLTFGYQAGRFLYRDALVTVAAGTVALTDDATNYVESNAAGVVSKNTVGFTDGAIPLYQITTAAGVQTATVVKLPTITLLGIGGITSELLTSTAALKHNSKSAGTINATKTIKLECPCAGTITRLASVVDTTLAANDTNFWTIRAVNKGASGTGVTPVLAETDGNTTKATGGSGLTNYVSRNYALHGTGANLVVAKGDVIALTFTKTAAAADLVELEAMLEVTPTA